MRFDEIVAILKAQVSEDKFINMNAEVLQPYVEIVAEALPAIARILYEHPELYFDYLACITGIDNGPEVGTMEVIYNLNSIPFSHQLTLRERSNEIAPKKNSRWCRRSVIFGVQPIGTKGKFTISWEFDLKAIPICGEF